MPDPTRAHGAWVYLFVSIGAGAMLGAARGVEPALLIGTGFAGGFLGTAAVVVGVQRRRRQLLVGFATALFAPLVALWLGAEREFLWVAASAAIVGVAAVGLARWRGFLSRTAMITGIAALALAGPAAAVAGGAGAARATALFALIWPFYSWRSLRVGAWLEADEQPKRAEVRARGLREAAIAAVWTLTVVFGLRLV